MLCKSRARNDVVWDVRPGSYTMSYLRPSRGNVVFAGLYHRADTTEVLLKVFSTFRETVPKAWHLPTEVGGGGTADLVCRARLVAIGVRGVGTLPEQEVTQAYPQIIPN